MLAPIQSPSAHIHSSEFHFESGFGPQSAPPAIKLSLHPMIHPMIHPIARAAAPAVAVAVAVAFVLAITLATFVISSKALASESTTTSTGRGSATQTANASTAASSVKASAGDAKAQVSVEGENSADSIAKSDRVPAGLTQLLSTSQYYSPYAFVVDKKARILSVWQQTENGLKKVATFPADLGKHSGNKQNRGDAKTPEGIYFLQNRLEGSALDSNLYGKRAFTTDYPNYFDRRQGKTGSGIWLHAVPDHIALTRGSSGCVVVRNDVILNLTQYVRLGRTPMLIQNQTDYQPASALQKENAEVTEWLEAWRDAWEKKDLSKYIAHYGEDFLSMKMNKQQWREYKAKLNDDYHSITVHISKPSIFFSNGNGIIRFLQEYASDMHTDFGEKTLYLKKDANGIHIIGESWAPESSKISKDEIENSSHATNAQTSGKNGANSTGATKLKADSRMNAGIQQ